MLTSQELWGSVIMLSFVGLALLFAETVSDEKRRSDETPFRWGDAQRRQRPDATWGNHTICAIAAALTVFTALHFLMP
jgi:hypothetical protein